MIKPESVKIPPDCDVVVRAIWDYLDGALDATRLAEFERHLERCDYCVAHTEFEARLTRELASLRRDHSDPERLRRQVQRALRAERGESEGDS